MVATQPCSSQRTLQRTHIRSKTVDRRATAGPPSCRWRSRVCHNPAAAIAAVGCAASTGDAQCFPSRRAMLQRLAAIAALTATGSEAPAAQAAAAVEAAERVAADRRGCVAAIAAIPSGRAAALGPQQLGSGIVWDKLGHIIVPYAPLTRLQRQGTAGDPTVFATVVAADGSRWELAAAIVAKDASHELAVLRVEPPPPGLRPAPLAASGSLRVGQDAFLLGALPDAQPSLAAGVISAVGRVIPASNNQAIPGVLQTDAEVGPQSLGGALLDGGGALVGMPVVSYAKPGVGRSSGVNFALPSDLLREVVPRLIVYGSAAVRR